MRTVQCGCVMFSGSCSYKLKVLIGWEKERFSPPLILLLDFSELCQRRSCLLFSISLGLQVGFSVLIDDGVVGEGRGGGGYVGKMCKFHLRSTYLYRSVIHSLLCGSI